MRWFCVAPELPEKASLRIRAAPNSDAEERGRFSKGKAVAAQSPPFSVGEDKPQQQWLHVAYPDQALGEWVEGFVMTQLPNGMTLLVPWENADFLRCCKIKNERARVYDGPHAAAQPVGFVGEGEGTRFPYGVREIDGRRMRIYHDVHERVWVDIHDAEPVCERLQHSNCSVPHSFFALNKELPPEAQIAVRTFPSREAETRALLSRGQVIEAEMRCGSWLKIAGAPESWIMWQTDTWQLLVELSSHESEACGIEMETGEAVDVPMHAESQMDNAVAIAESEQILTSEDMEVGGEAIAITEETEVQVEEQQQESRTDSSSVGSLCDGLASHDISGHEEEEQNGVVDEATCVADAGGLAQPSSEQLSWEDRPLDVKNHYISRQEEEEQYGAVDEATCVADAGGLAQPSSEQLSWEDRPLDVQKAANDDHADKRGDAPLITEQELHVTVAEAEQLTQTTAASWDDRPIGSSQGTYDWESAYPPPVDPPGTMNDTSAQVERVVKKEDQGMQCDPDEGPADTSMAADSAPMDEPRGAIEDENVVEPTQRTLSWEDRPISTSRGTYNWEDAYPPSSELRTDEPLDGNVPTSSFEHEEAPEKATPMEELDQTSAKEETEFSSGTDVEKQQPAKFTVSCKDRPIGGSRGTYDWETTLSPLPDTSTDPLVECSSKLNDETSATKAEVGEKDDSNTGARVPVDEESKSSNRVHEAQVGQSTEDFAATNNSQDVKEWHWEEAPIKSRHAKKAAQDMSVDPLMAEGHGSSPSQYDDASDDNPWKYNRRAEKREHQASYGESRSEPSPDAASSHGSQNPESHTIRSAGCVVPDDNSSIAWHSVDSIEEPGASDNGGDFDVPDEEPARSTQTQTRHSSTSAIGVVSADHSSVTRHSSGPVKEAGVLDEGSRDLVVDQDPAVEDAVAAGDATHEESTNVPLGSDHYESTQIETTDAMDAERVFGTGWEQRGYEAGEQDKEYEESQIIDQADSHRGEEDTHESLNDAQPHSIDLQTSDDIVMAEREETISSVIVDRNDYNARLREILKKETSSHPVYRILKAIALDEGSDAILEALATSGEFDEELLKYELPSRGPPAVAFAPSPSSSETGLLDVLYSRDQEEGFSTPKKQPGRATSSTPQGLSTGGTKEERLEALLRRTPLKAPSSHSKIINNANPDDILESEFGSCVDELDLFGSYRYPTVSTGPQFSSGMTGTPTSAFSTLQSPSFASSSFTSPPPKENPLKRSASSIAKTPPVALPKSAAPPQSVMPPTPKPVVQVPPPPHVAAPAPAPVPAPVPRGVRSTAVPSSRLPPSARTTTPAARPSLAAPSAGTSRVPMGSGLTKPVPPVTRARSFTTGNDVHQTGGIPTRVSAVPTIGMARTQSMLPRKSALQAPSPLKFGIHRTNSLASSAAGGTAGPRGLEAAPPGEASVDPRRLSFGFSRPSFTKKQ